MKLRSLLSVSVSLTVLASASAQADSITPIPDLPGGFSISNAYGISADGTTVVGQSHAGSGFEAFYWTSGGGGVGMGDLPGGAFSSVARAASADGSIIVGSGRSAAGFEAFYWTSGGGMVGIGDLAGGIFNSNANAVSADGSVIVGDSISGAGSQAFIWTSGGGMSGLGDLAGGAFDSAALGVSGDGSIVVGYSSSASGYQAFSWTSGGGMVGLGDLAGGSFTSSANAISSDGTVIVGVGESANGIEAFMWTSGGGMVGLGDLAGGGFNSTASAVNANGSVIVGNSSDAAGSSAFRWTQANGMQSLSSLLTAAGVNLTGWTLEQATGVDASGETISGYGILSGVASSYIANLSLGGLSTPDAILEGILPASVPAQQAQSAINNGMGQSLFAATNSLAALDTHIIDTSNPSLITPAAGDFDRTWSAYAVGSFGIGQNNDTDNHSLNGTTGIAVQMTDHLSLGLGVIGSSGHEDLSFDGDSDLGTLGGSLLAAYKDPSGFRFYGTAFAARLDVETNRRYQNGGGFDGSNGETDGLGYGAAFRTGWEFPVSAQTSWMPYGELSATHTKLDGYTETGGGFPAAFGDQSSTEVTSRLGAQIEHHLTPNLSIGGRAAWAHRIKEGESGLSVTSVGFTGTLSDNQSDRNWGELTATTKWQIAPETSVSAELSGRSGRTEEPAGTLTIGLKVGF